MSGVTEEMNPEANNVGAEETEPLEMNQLSDGVSETSGVPASDEEKEIMKLLDMEGLGGDIAGTLPDSSNSETVNDESHGQDSEANNAGDLERQLGDSYFMQEIKDNVDTVPETTPDQNKAPEKHEKDPFGGEKEEKPDITQPLSVLQELAQKEQEQKNSQQAGDNKADKEPKEEPTEEPQSSQDGEHKVIKVLVKSEEPDPLEALQLHLQKTQEDMAKHQQDNIHHHHHHQQQQHNQQQQVSPARPVQAYPANSQQGQPMITQIKQEPGVQSNQQTEQQLMQQQQLKYRQLQMQQQQQQQRMQQQQQANQQYKPGAGNVRPPPPLQDMRQQMQMMSSGGGSVREGPVVQCEICHRTFLNERGYLSHRHVHTEAPQPPKPIILPATSCKTCLARARFRMACASGKADPGKVDFSAPCAECGSKTIPNLPASDTVAMRQVYNQGVRQRGPYVMPGTVRTMHQQQQRGSLQQRMAHQAQRFAGMYRQQGSFQSNHANRVHKVQDDDDIKIVGMTPGRPSHRSPAKSPQVNKHVMRSPNHSASPAKRRHLEENGQTTPTKTPKSDTSSSTSNSSSSEQSRTVVSPEVSSTASTLGQQDDQNTDGLLDLLVKQKKIYECTHCKILFREFSLYAVHIGMHSSDNPMQCSMCGKACSSKFEFLCHHNNNKM